MNKNWRDRLVLSILAALALVACREFGDIRVYSKGDGLYFAPEGAQAFESVVIYDVGVDRLDCDSNCTVWQITLKDNHEMPVSQDSFSAIRFGHAPEIFKVLQEVPDEIVPGRYSVGMTVGYRSKPDGQTRFKLLHRDFTVTRGDNGNLQVATERE
jgi:hypothetical protein